METNLTATNFKHVIAVKQYNITWPNTQIGGDQKNNKQGDLNLSN